MPRPCYDELNDAAADDGTGAILLEGRRPGLLRRRRLRGRSSCSPFGRRIAKPLIAAVQGVAISGGLAMVANAHVVVAAQGTSFGFTDHSRRAVERTAFIARLRGPSASAGARTRPHRTYFLHAKKRWRGDWCIMSRPPLSWTIAPPKSPPWSPTRTRTPFAKRCVAVLLSTDRNTVLVLASYLQPGSHAAPFIRRPTPLFRACPHIRRTLD